MERLVAGDIQQLFAGFRAPSNLLSFVDSIEAVFCKKIRESALDWARSSIVNNSLTLWARVGDEPKGPEKGRLPGVLSLLGGNPCQIHIEASSLLYPRQPPKISEGTYYLVDRLYEVAATYLEWVRGHFSETRKLKGLLTSKAVKRQEVTMHISSSPTNTHADTHTTNTHHPPVDAHDTTLGVGDTPHTLGSETQPTNKLPSMIWQTAAPLLATCRDMVWMFIATAPLYWEKFIRETVWGAILLLNDCQYLANHLAHLNTCLNLDLVMLGCPDRSPAILVDLVPHLLTVGRRVFKAQLQRQKSLLVEELNHAATLFGTVETDDQRFELHSSIERVLLQLTPVNKICLELLTERETRMIMVGLYCALAERLVEIVLSLSDISAENGASMHEILCTVLEGLGVEGSGVQEGSKEYKAELVAALKGSPPVRRLMQVRSLLQPEQSLLGVTNEFSQGQLADLSSNQLTHLVCAVWTETDKRASLLARISGRTK